MVFSLGTIVFIKMAAFSSDWRSWRGLHFVVKVVVCSAAALAGVILKGVFLYIINPNKLKEQSPF